MPVAWGYQAIAQGLTYPTARQPGQVKLSVGQEDLDKFFF